MTPDTCMDRRRGAFQPLLSEGDPGRQPALEPRTLHDLADSLFALGAPCQWRCWLLVRERSTHASLHPPARPPPGWSAGNAGASDGVKRKNRDALYQLSRQLHQAAEKAPQQQPCGAQQAPHLAPEPPAADVQPPPPAQQLSSAATRGTRPLSRLSRPQGTAPAAAVAANAAGANGCVLGAAVAAGPSSPTTARKSRRQKAEAEVVDTPSSEAADRGAAMQRATGDSPTVRTTRANSAAAAAKTAAPADQAAPSEACESAPGTRVRVRAQATSAAETPRPATAPSAPPSAKRKSVQFLMKKNLYFEHGGDCAPARNSAAVAAPCSVHTRSPFYMAFPGHFSSV